MIKIVQFLAYFPPHKGGLEFHAQEWAKNRTKNNFGQVLNVVSSIGQKQESGLIEEHGYQTVVIPSVEIIPTFPLPKFWTKEYRDALNIIKKFDADIYQTRTRFFLFSFWGGLLSKFHKKKRIHIEHGVDYVKLNAQRKNMIARIYDWTLGFRTFRNADHVIGISQGCKRFAQKFTKKKIPVIYRGIEFTPGKRVEDETMIRLGFVGRLVKLKGVEDILHSIALLQKNNSSKISFKIVGDGEERAELEKLTKKLGIQKTVTFLGFMDHKQVEQVFLPSTDIYINASYQEGLPPTVVEALLAGCITIATRVGGTPEISDQKDLILVEPGKPEQITKALETAIENKRLRSGKSRELVKKKFDRTNNIQQYFDLYKTL